MNKGIVMELSDSSIIVMCPDGRFEKLPRGTRSCEVGEEILYAPVKRGIRVPQMAIASGLAAAIVFCFVLVSTLTGSVPSGQVVAYVSIDINPSVEIGIDNQEVVQELHGLNTDGDNLIQSLAYKGKSLEIVTSDILDKAEQGALGKGEGDIIISSTVVQDKTAINDEAIAAKLKDQVSKHIEQAHPDQVKNYEVTAFAAPQEIRQEAKASGVSAGKYAIYLNALDNGTKVSLDDIKSVSIHQLAKDNGGIDKLVNPDKPINKSSLKQLVDDEKSGKLNDRYQELIKGNSDKDKDDKKDQNSKSTAKPTRTPQPTPKNDKSSNNDKNNRDDKNDKNDRNGKNNGKDSGKDNGKADDDKQSPSKKPDRNNDDEDDSKKNTSQKLSTSPSAKPTLKPPFTTKPSFKPTPTPKEGDGSDSDSKGKGNDRDKNNHDKSDNQDGRNKDQKYYNEDEDGRD